MNSGFNKLLELKNKEKNGIWDYIITYKSDLLKKFRISTKYLRKNIEKIEIGLIIGNYILKNISTNNDYILLYFQTEAKIDSVLMIINKTENEEDYMIVDCSSLQNIFDFIKNLYQYLAGAK
jgi:hypothetical protein